MTYNNILRSFPLCFFSLLMTKQWMFDMNGSMSVCKEVIAIEYFVYDDYRRSSHSIILMAL